MKTVSKNSSDIGNTAAQSAEQVAKARVVAAA